MPNWIESSHRVRPGVPDDWLLYHLRLLASNEDSSLRNLDDHLEADEDLEPISGGFSTNTDMLYSLLHLLQYKL